jgi:arylsulfatase A-like enzyme
MSSQFKAANINQAVHTVDIVPSILKIIAIKNTSDLDGKSLDLEKSVPNSY